MVRKKQLEEKYFDLYNHLRMNQTPLNTRLGGAGKFMELKNIPESIFDAIPDVIGVLDHDFGIIKFNTAGYEYFNLTHSELQGVSARFWHYQIFSKQELLDQFIDHREVVDALRKREGKRAGETLKNHIQKVLKKLGDKVLK